MEKENRISDETNNPNSDDNDKSYVLKIRNKEENKNPDNFQSEGVGMETKKFQIDIF